MRHITYIHERLEWTQWQLSDKSLLPLVSRVRILQGRLLSQLSTLGFDLSVKAQLETVTLEVVKTSEIEGEILNNEQVRSSVAHHLGIDVIGTPSPTPKIDVVVEMMLAATYSLSTALTIG